MINIQEINFQMSRDSHAEDNCDEIEEKNRTFKLIAFLWEGGGVVFAILDHPKTYQKGNPIVL